MPSRENDSMKSNRGKRREETFGVNPRPQAAAAASGEEDITEGGENQGGDNNGGNNNGDNNPPGELEG